MYYGKIEFGIIYIIYYNYLKIWLKKSIQLNYILFRIFSANINSSRQNQSLMANMDFICLVFHFKVKH